MARSSQWPVRRQEWVHTPRRAPDRFRQTDALGALRWCRSLFTVATGLALPVVAMGSSDLAMIGA